MMRFQKSPRRGKSRGMTLKHGNNKVYELSTMACTRPYRSSRPGKYFIPIVVIVRMPIFVQYYRPQRPAGSRRGRPGIYHQIWLRRASKSPALTQAPANAEYQHAISHVDEGRNGLMQYDESTSAVLEATSRLGASESCRIGYSPSKSILSWPADTTLLLNGRRRWMRHDERLR